MLGDRLVNGDYLGQVPLKCQRKYAYRIQVSVSRGW